MLSDIRVFAKKVRAASDAAAARTGGHGFKFTYKEEPGRVHSWPMLPLPHLKAKQGFLFDFFERALGLQPADGQLS